MKPSLPQRILSIKRSCVKPCGFRHDGTIDGSKFRKSRGRPKVDEETERLVVLVSRRREIVMLYER